MVFVYLLKTFVYLRDTDRKMKGERMEVKNFVENYCEAFGTKAELPIGFWYSDEETVPAGKTNGCLFKCLKEVRAGGKVSLNAATIGCGGGQFYSGFIDFPERIPAFVSLKERYKQTPGMVKEFVEELKVPRATGTYLNFARIDVLDDFEGLEGVLFLATPDILSGLFTWACYDNNEAQAVSSIFGSGCSSVITQAVVENRCKGRRTFLGFFDPSVRPYVEANVLSFVIPLARFREMLTTMRSSCLFDTHAWGKIRERINQ